MEDIIFREYDIRGIVDQELYIDQVYNLTRAIAHYFQQHNPNIKTIALGMDGRIHSPAIKAEICRGLIDSGLDVLFVGMCPTPALYFSLFTQPVDGGLMITASHNSKEFNGIKVCLGTDSVWGTELQAIKKLYKKKASIKTSLRGTIKNYPIIPHYIAWLTQHFNHLKGITLKIIIDCGNGAAGTVLPDLIKAMQWPNVSLLYADVDGRYPNHEADPTVPENMQDLKQLIIKTDTAFGIGLDGDCDRMIPITKEGTLVPGDQLLALFAKQLLQKHPASSIVFDIKSSAGLIELLNIWQANPIMSPSGHSIIKNMMHIHHALLGGELSGHFFFKDHYFGYDDGIYALLRLCEIIHESQQPLTQLLTIFPRKYNSPELRLSCAEGKKKEIIAKLAVFFNTFPDAHLITIDGIRVIFPFGWGLVRPSNTQAMLSMRFESDTKIGLRNIMILFYDALKTYLAPSVLKTLTHQMELV